jgi:hypothetical protein
MSMSATAAVAGTGTVQSTSITKPVGALSPLSLQPKAPAQAMLVTTTTTFAATTTSSPAPEITATLPSSSGSEEDQPPMMVNKAKKSKKQGSRPAKEDPYAFAVSNVLSVHRSGVPLQRRTALMDNQHKQLPSLQRVDDLKERWPGPANFLTPFERKCSASDFNLLGKPTGWETLAFLDSPPKQPTDQTGATATSPTTKQAVIYVTAAQVEADRREHWQNCRADWQAKVIVDDPVFRVQWRLYNGVEKFSSLLHDPPAKLGFRQTHCPPAPIAALIEPRHPGKISNKKRK